MAQVSGGVFVLTRAVVQGDNFLVFQTLGSPDQETLIGDVHDRLIDSIEFQA